MDPEQKSPLLRPDVEEVEIMDGRKSVLHRTVPHKWSQLKFYNVRSMLSQCFIPDLLRKLNLALGETNGEFPDVMMAESESEW